MRVESGGIDPSFPPYLSTFNFQLSIFNFHFSTIKALAAVNSILQVENLTKSFGDLVLFENISLGLSEGQRVGLIAKNGSGKTTLLNLLEVQLGDRTHYSHNANSAYGICFDILGMDGVRGSKLKWLYLFVAAPITSLWFKHKQEFYVVEIDGERPKETEFLARWLKPEVTLWVSVGRTHAVYFDDNGTLVLIYQTLLILSLAFYLA